MSMKVIVGILYLVTGILGLYWALQLTLMGMYGTPFSWWYAAIAVGSLILILGAILGWASGRPWTEWVPLIGSLVLAAYFLPAVTITVYRYIQGHAPGGGELVVRLAMVVLVLASLGMSASSKFNLASR